VELHRLSGTPEPWALDFLRHHFLLTSVGKAGVLTWQDVSTGELVSQRRTRLGPCGVLASDPRTAVSVLGHGGGEVSLWTPNQPTATARLLAHKGPVRALAVDLSGTYLVTAGLDRQVKARKIERDGGRRNGAADWAVGGACEALSTDPAQPPDQPDPNTPTSVLVLRCGT